MEYLSEENSEWKKQMLVESFVTDDGKVYSGWAIYVIAYFRNELSRAYLSLD